MGVLVGIFASCACEIPHAGVAHGQQKVQFGSDQKIAKINDRTNRRGFVVKNELPIQEQGVVVPGAAAKIGRLYIARYADDGLDAFCSRTGNPYDYG